MTTARLSKIGHHPDYFLLALTLILTIVGLTILASASSELGASKFGDSYYYLKHQISNGLLVGLLGGAVAYFLHYQRYRRFAFFILLVNLVFLALVFTDFGIVAGGASRWVSTGGVSFQPAELLKITYILYLAAWLTNPKIDRTKDISQGLMPFLVVSGVVAALLLAQPATSVVAILLLAGGMIYFLSGARWKHIAISIGVGGVAIGLLLFASYAGIISRYRWERVATFFSPAQDTEDSGYQLQQALMAISQGKLTGVGYGQSAVKVGRLPAPVDDSIFAIAAQELGFIGASGIIMLFGLLVFRLFWLAQRLRDRFGALILVGFGMIIAIQSIVNMGAISGLIPLTGVPLPFVSYGGTALAVFLTMSGMALNISKYT